MNERVVYDLVLDIETVGADLSDEEWEYLIRREKEFPEGEREFYRNKVKKQVALWGLTGHVVSVAMGVVARKEDGASLAKVKVMYLADGNGERTETVPLNGEDYTVQFVRYDLSGGIEGAEREIIREVWYTLTKVRGRLVTYNGRRFDLPFLMLRSLVLDLPISKYHLGNRFDYTGHIDVMDVLSFHGLGRFSSLDFVCKRLRIPTPKVSMDGSEVEKYFHNGRYDDIATYNFYDVWATTAVYDRVLRILGPMLQNGYR